MGAVDGTDPSGLEPAAPGRPTRLCRTLAPRPQAAGEARLLARRALSDWGLDPWTDRVCLVVSELVTNAVMHACTELTFELEVVGERVRAAVTDASGTLPRHRSPGPSQEHGRGVHLVAMICARWGTDVLPDGKCVWAEIGVTSPAGG